MTIETLNEWVNALNDEEGLSVTISVKGMVVNGKLLSYERYLDGYMKVISGFGDPLNAKLASFFESNRETFESEWKGNVFLKDVTLLPANIKMPFWSIPESAIDGVSLAGKVLL
jgi:hypothetical protein